MSIIGSYVCVHAYVYAGFPLSWKSLGGILSWKDMENGQTNRVMNIENNYIHGKVMELLYCLSQIMQEKF